MKISRSTFRTAAVATGVAAALALPATAAFADDATDQTVTTPTVQNDDTVTTPPKGEGPDADHTAGDNQRAKEEGGDKDKVTTPGTGDETKKPDEAKKPDETKKPDVKPTEPSFIRTEKLEDGSVAKIYKTGDTSFKAVITLRDGSTQVLTTDGSKDATVRLQDGMYISLAASDGNVVSWYDPLDKPKPQPKPNHHHNAHQKPHVHQQQKPATKPAQKVFPKGGVKAGAENVSGTSAATDTALLAAGGGLAAAGAAGLGFAVLRRRGHQG
ncbi:hypothetical protein ACIO3O_03480 [Streptomyces sp. NPDC087440]|uniref:hypothetical protein n=1 Tax=Streptomyces sp. NPDC087440 TaxID=3365790 RepID=UPI003801CBD6